VTIELRLLDGVSYAGEPLAGARSADLLAALVLHRSGVSDARLLDEVWADHPPTSSKVLQVQVSRVRAQCGPEVVQRYDGGYRLGLPDDAVDLWVLETLAERARSALAEGDPRAALAAADGADDLLCGIASVAGDGPLTDVRRRGLALGPALARTHALALGRAGRDAEAVGLLARVHERDPDDAEVLVTLLRSEASAVGAGVHWPGTTPTGATSPTGWESIPSPRCSACTASYSPPTTRSAAACATTPTTCSVGPTTWPGCGRWSGAAG